MNIQAHLEALFDKMAFLDRCGQNDAADAFRVAMDIMKVFEEEVRELFETQREERLS